MTEDRASSTPSETSPYQPAPEPTPQLVSKPNPKPLITQEEHEAKRAARNVQSIIDREEARLTPRARRAMLQALHEASGAGLEAMDRSELEAAQKKAEDALKLIGEMEQVAPAKAPPGILFSQATVNAQPSSPAPADEDDDDEDDE